MKELDQVILAALLHNINKFYSRERLWEHLTQCLSNLDMLKLNQRSTSLQQLIQAASYFASTEQGKALNNNDGGPASDRTYLEPLLTRVTLQPAVQQPRINYYHPLSPLSLEQTTIYPQLLKTEDISNLQAHYQTLLQAFETQLFKKLPRPRKDDDISWRNLVYNLMSLFERFLVYVPAETHLAHSDITLFDQLRITAAIAEGLYRYHQRHNDLETADFLDETTPKWCLVCGDFSGIQTFIYRLTAKGAAKGLRGRSLYIQLLCDGVSQYLLRKMGLYPTTRIYSSGGKFYLLIAAGQEALLKTQVEHVNQWLLNVFQGEVFLGIGTTPIRATDFHGGRMGTPWKIVNEELQQNRLQRFISSINKDFFTPISTTQSHCQVCGREDVQAHIQFDAHQERQICQQCRELENLGQKIASAEYFLWVWEVDRQVVKAELAQAPVCQFEALAVDLYVLETYPHLDKSPQYMVNTLLERINHPDCLDNNALGYQCGFRLLGRWEQQKRSHDWTFDIFAEQAVGIKRMGILRMDVDNLGEIFARGLDFLDDQRKVQSMGSLSRIATLSRQLNLFFSGHLNELLRSYERTQIIYAGGDDLFLIGSWDELPQVADTIRTHFSQYCAHNSCFTLSGGLTLVGGKYPLSKAAELAGEAEKRAKDMPGKNSLCLLETPIPWKGYEEIKYVRDQIIQIIELSHHRAVIDRLRTVILAMLEYERRANREGKKGYQEIQELVQYQKWRWQLVYNLARMKQRHPQLEAQLEEIQSIVFTNQVKGKNMLLSMKEWLPLPVRWAEFLTREESIS